MQKMFTLGGILNQLGAIDNTYYLGQINYVACDVVLLCTCIFMCSELKKLHLIVDSVFKAFTDQC